MVFIRCNLHCCYKGFVLWIFIEGVPSEPRTSGSFFSLEFSGLHYCLFVNVLCFKLFVTKLIRRSFHIISCFSIVCQALVNITTYFFFKKYLIDFALSISQRRKLSYHSVFHLSTRNCIFFHIILFSLKVPHFSI